MGCYRCQPRRWPPTSRRRTTRPGWTTCFCRRTHSIGFWTSPDFSRTVMPSSIPPVLRSVAKRFLNEYGSRLRPFEEEYEVAPGVVVRRTGGHTPGHSVVSLASGGDRLTFLGDAVFPVGFDHPDWHNGFEHDPEEAARVRVRLLREAAATGEPLVAAHLSFPFGRVAVA